MNKMWYTYDKLLHSKENKRTMTKCNMDKSHQQGRAKEAKQKSTFCMNPHRQSSKQAIEVTNWGKGWGEDLGEYNKKAQTFAVFLFLI